MKECLSLSLKKRHLAFTPFLSSLFRLKKLTSVIHHLRIWMTFVALINLASAIICHDWIVTKLSALIKQGGKDFALCKWDSYARIILSALIFVGYLYSIKEKRIFHNKFVRATSMLFGPCSFSGSVSLIFISWSNSLNI